jgi:hypothetical protein
LFFVKPGGLQTLGGTRSSHCSGDCGGFNPFGFIGLDQADRLGVQLLFKPLRFTLRCWCKTVVAQQALRPRKVGPVGQQQQYD